MNDTTPTGTEAAVVVETALKAATPQPLTLDFGTHQLPCIATSDLVNVTHLEQFLKQPLRARGTTSLLNLKNLQKFLLKQDCTKANTFVFADKDALLFTAILNASTQLEPAWADHRATVQLKKTRQLQNWQSNNKKKMSQEAFALFLEEFLEDIVSPVATEVLHFAETLEARRTEVFKSSIRTSTGECNLVFSSERDGDHNTVLIENFTLGIPLFDGGPAYEVKVKLFHRVIEQKLTFWYELRQIDYILDKAWEAEVEFLNETLSSLAHVFEGKAPSPTPCHADL